MKTRKKRQITQQNNNEQPINNSAPSATVDDKLVSYDDQEKRPSREFLESIKSMISNSPAMLQKHPMIFGLFTSVNKYYKQMETAFNDVEKLAHDAELSRPLYNKNQDEKLYGDYDYYQGTVDYYNSDIENVKSDKTAKEWQAKEQSLGKQLQDAQKLQQDYNNQQKATEALRNLNIAKDQKTKLHADAKTQVDQLEKQIDATNCCVPRAKVNKLQGALELQRTAVQDHQKSLDDLKRQITAAPIPAMAIEPPDAKDLETLQKSYATAKSTASYYMNHKDEIIADAQKRLDDAQADVTKAVRAINRSILHYYADNNTQVMHGLIRLYANFASFKVAFEAATHKNEDASEYKTMLEDQKTKLDGLLGQLWCDKFAHLTAMEIYKRFLASPPAAREKLLSQKPDTTALSQLMSLPTVAGNSMFSKLSDEEKKKITVGHRDYLHKQKATVFKG